MHKNYQARPLIKKNKDHTAASAAFLSAIALPSLPQPAFLGAGHLQSKVQWIGVREMTQEIKGFPCFPILRMEEVLRQLDN